MTCHVTHNARVKPGLQGPLARALARSLAGGDRADLSPSAGSLFGSIAPKGMFDIIEFAWVIAPFKSERQAIYCVGFR
jgi:hypothetical protein